MGPLMRKTRRESTRDAGGVLLFHSKKRYVFIVTYFDLYLTDFFVYIIAHEKRFLYSLLSSEFVEKNRSIEAILCSDGNSFFPLKHFYVVMGKTIPI